MYVKMIGRRCRPSPASTIARWRTSPRHPQPPPSPHPHPRPMHAPPRCRYNRDSATAPRDDFYRRGGHPIPSSLIRRTSASTSSGDDHHRPRPGGGIGFDDDDYHERRLLDRRPVISNAKAIFDENHRRIGTSSPRGGDRRARRIDDDEASDPRRRDQDDGNDDGNNRNRHRNNRHRRTPRRHSTRLIGENDARRITDTFVDSSRDHRSSWTISDLLSAESALEYWAHRADYDPSHTRGEGANDDVRRDDGDDHRRRDIRGTKGGGGGRGKEDGGGRPSGSYEDDANTALRLFESLHRHHFRRAAIIRDDDTDGTRRNDVPIMTSDDIPVLTNGMYSHVVDALSKSTNLHHVRLADHLLRQFVNLYLSRHRHDVVDIDIAVERTRGADVGSTSTSTSFECPDGLRWNDGDRHHLPNRIRITGVMRGYARHSRPDDAESLLELMISLSSSSSRVAADDSNRRRSHDRASTTSLFRPNDVSYATVIDAYSRVNDGPNAERVLGMMKRGIGGSIDDVIAAADGEHRGINRANVVAYNAAISAWARSANKRGVGSTGSSSSKSSPPTRDEIASSRSAAECAERLLREMWSEHDNCRRRTDRGDRSGGGIALLPDVVTYSAVISAYANCLDQPHGVGRARELLAELEGLAAQEVDGTTRHRGDSAGNLGERTRFDVDGGGDGGGGGRHPHGFRPNTLTYNSIIQAYANAGDASSAEGVLLSMISLYKSSLEEEGGGGCFRHVRPNTRTFNVVLNAHAKRKGGDGGFWAGELLRELEELESGGDGFRLDVISYNTVLSAWSKSAGVSPKSHWAKGMDKQLNRIRREKWASSDGRVGDFAAYEALELLNQIENRYLQSIGDEAHGHSHVVKPDVISYNTTIVAFANAAQHHEDGTLMASKAEEILTRMIKFGVEPDAYSYNGVLLAWARSSGGLNAAKHAEGILRLMERPTMVSWSTVVTAYANANCPDRAEALLREMEESATSSPGSNGHLTPMSPSIVLYNNVLHSWAMSSHDDMSRNAELLLNRMEGASSSPPPDGISYRLVLNALEHTKDHDKAERAKSILDRLLAHELRQSRFKAQEIQNAYNSVLRACVYTRAEAGEHHRGNAARILVETLRDMNQFPWSADDGSPSGPNQETYAHFVQGCIHLYESSSMERNELLKLAFYECCRKGLLNEVIWEKCCAAIESGALELINEISSSGGDMPSNYEELPGEWSRNVKGRAHNHT